MEVKIRDFNCIENVELEFRPGFTILQGPSNSGKSSIIKAIENCIFNQSGTTNVRQGCKNYSIGIKKDDRTVSLIKGKDTKYKVDDVIYEKIGVSQLAEVAESLNIRETILGGEKVRLNFSKQMSYPFLLDKTPGQLYKFIVDSSESESLSNVLKDISKDIKDLDKSLSYNEAQIDLLTKQQIQINNNLENSDQILEASNKIIELDGEYQKINQLRECNRLFSSISTDISNLTGQISLYDINIDLDGLEKLYDEYTCYNDVYSKYLQSKSENDLLLSKIDKYNIIINVEDLDDEYNILIKMNNLLHRFNIVNEDINLLENNIRECNEKIDQLDKDLSEFKVCPLCGGEIHE